MQLRRSLRLVLVAALAVWAAATADIEEEDDEIFFDAGDASFEHIADPAFAERTIPPSQPDETAPDVTILRPDVTTPHPMRPIAAAPKGSWTKTILGTLLAGAMWYAVWFYAQMSAAKQRRREWKAVGSFEKELEAAIIGGDVAKASEFIAAGGNTEARDQPGGQTLLMVARPPDASLVLSSAVPSAVPPSPRPVLSLVAGRRGGGQHQAREPSAQARGARRRAGLQGRQHDAAPLRVHQRPGGRRPAAARGRGQPGASHLREHDDRIRHCRGEAGARRAGEGQGRDRHAAALARRASGEGDRRAGRVCCHRASDGCGQGRQGRWGGGGRTAIREVQAGGRRLDPWRAEGALPARASPPPCRTRATLLEHSLHPLPARRRSEGSSSSC